MVELLTSPIDGTGLPYQVVLFMTRSEIRDIEQLIQQRVGAITTLTCSKDYPSRSSQRLGYQLPSCANLSLRSHTDMQTL